ncbi:MAG: MarR family winged helix-turn-helix transcriptional regulator [Calditrichia bacterium]
MELEKEIKQKRFRSEYHKLVLNIVYTGNWISTNNMQWLRKFGLSSQQYNILRILRGQHPNPATGNLLKDRMLDKMSNTSRLVEKLRLKNLVERKTCPKDRRAVDIIITDEGMKLLQKIDEHEHEWVNQFATLSEAETKTLNTLLDKLRG